MAEVSIANGDSFGELPRQPNVLKQPTPRFNRECRVGQINNWSRSNGAKRSTSGT